MPKKWQRALRETHFTLQELHDECENWRMREAYRNALSVIEQTRDKYERHEEDPNGGFKG